ncbi:HAD family hydrolase [Methylophilus medardicus]|uniref:HAD-IIIA family hydrolase n=1 Tax=Methylophilus medardicus TaxID=2588534 RepID=A0A5B8CRV3_9PROT|nr:HAD-IIIA family hydrolase [Methylophilus medardicus]QDC44003.1 HAD-IIIA family hydrolase [Methylophilus medardicus]QDC49010.1 HAD-IIIA family hydrolase [Methylophilus medardicus]QDC52715.1 HAD-IIIA family hydrolase [Methylophilus medardicus]
MKQFDLIVWDWDGTVADSTGLISQALIQAAQEAGLPELSESRARSIIGLGLRESIQVLFGDIPASQAQALATHYQRNYYANENNILLFAGIAETIVALSKKGIKLAVATGKGRRGLNTALQQSGLAKYFHATKTVDECFSKPHPQMLDELMDELVAMPARTLMIGDSQYDLQMGKNAGVMTAAVSYGSQTAAHLSQYSPDYLFDDVATLSAWLLEQT